MRTLKVALFSDNVAYSTFAGVISGWSHALVAAGQNDIDIVSYVGDPAVEAHSPFPPEVTFVNLPASRTLYAILALRRYLESTAPDILVSAGTHVNLAALVAAKLSRWPGKLIISNHHPIALEHAFSRKDNKYLASIMYPWAAGLIAVSPTVLQDGAQKCRLKPEQMECVPNVLPPVNSIDDSSPVHAWLSTERPEGPVFVTLSRLAAVKNYPLLLDAFAQVAAKLDSRLLILGSGPEQQNIRSMIEAKGLVGKVALTGFVDSTLPYLRKADAFVIASNEEGFCQVLAEAMREGLPVISTDAQGGGPKFVLDGGRCGMLVPMQNVDALAQAMLAMEDVDVRKKFSELGQRRILDFSPEAVSDVLYSFILRIHAPSN